MKDLTHMSKAGPQNADLTDCSCSFHFFIIAPVRCAHELNSTFRFCATHQDVANQFMHRRAVGSLSIFVIRYAYIRDFHCEPLMLVYF